MENSKGESYDGGQKRDRIYYVNKRIDARDPRYIVMYVCMYLWSHIKQENGSAG